MKVCSVCGITEKEKHIRISKKYNAILCEKHVAQLHKYNKILNRTIFDKNEVIIKGNYAEITIYDKNKQIKGYSKIDKNDIERIKNIKWYISDNKYVRCSINKNKIFLHRYILDIKDKREIDHINHDTLDNRKQNLRIVNRSQNNMNHKPYKNKDSKNITYLRNKNKWWARIQVNGKVKSLGIFSEYKDAKNKRIEAEKFYYKEYRYKYE